MFFCYCLFVGTSSFPSATVSKLCCEQVINWSFWYLWYPETLAKDLLVKSFSIATVGSLNHQNQTHVSGISKT
jgi:hypothetical protein